MKYTIELSDEEIIKIHKFYERQCLLEFVANNNTDWSDEKIEFVANRAYEILQEDINYENKHYAIESAWEEWEEMNAQKI